MSRNISGSFYIKHAFLAKCRAYCSFNNFCRSFSVFKNLKVNSNSFDKFEKTLYCSYCTKTVSKCNNKCVSHKNFKNYNVRYGVLMAFIAACGLFLYSHKEKLKSPFYFIPNNYPLENSYNSLRKRFNFIADVVEKSANSVVCIESLVLLRNGVQSVVPRGSGFIVGDDGLILTNAHVVINHPNTSIQVKLKDGRIFAGDIEDVDLTADLATVHIKAKNLPVMDLGSSSDLRAGEWVVAIGSPLSLTDSVSAGVVSSPQRKGEDLGMRFKDMQYIQTDAAITFGNSGGPLVNLDGEAVGVNSMKVTTGISFAIPIEYAKEFLRKSEEKRKKKKGETSVLKGKRNYIGVSMLTLTPHLLHVLNHKYHEIPEFLINGIFICQVIIDSPAFKSGLQPGDVITEINGIPVNGVKSLYKALEMGVTLTIKIFRRGRTLNVVISPEHLI